ncbi:MAG: hypothetical protein QOF48_3538 [Verrucomicrobiota bacterium]|jgi:hypothetical protein
MNCPNAQCHANYETKFENLPPEFAGHLDTVGRPRRLKTVLNDMSHQLPSNGRPRAACVGTDEAAVLFGWPVYYMPFLVSAGHLKPLGKPSQNSRKWFATVELERLAADPEWLDKAIRIIEKRIREMNGKQSGKVSEDLAA